MSNPVNVVILNTSYMPNGILPPPSDTEIQNRAIYASKVKNDVNQLVQNQILPIWNQLKHEKGAKPTRVIIQITDNQTSIKLKVADKWTNSSLNGQQAQVNQSILQQGADIWDKTVQESSLTYRTTDSSNIPQDISTLQQQLKETQLQIKQELSMNTSLHQKIQEHTELISQYEQDVKNLSMKNECLIEEQLNSTKTNSTEKDKLLLEIHTLRELSKTLEGKLKETNTSLQQSFSQNQELISQIKNSNQQNSSLYSQFEEINTTNINRLKTAQDTITTLQTQLHNQQESLVTGLKKDNVESQKKIKTLEEETEKLQSQHSSQITILKDQIHTQEIDLTHTNEQLADLTEKHTSFQKNIEALKTQQETLKTLHLVEIKKLNQEHNQELEQLHQNSRQMEKRHLEQTHQTESQTRKHINSLTESLKESTNKTTLIQAQLQQQDSANQKSLDNINLQHTTDLTLLKEHYTHQINQLQEHIEQLKLINTTLLNPDLESIEAIDQPGFDSVNRINQYKIQNDIIRKQYQAVFEENTSLTTNVNMLQNMLDTAKIQFEKDQTTLEQKVLIVTQKNDLLKTQEDNLKDLIEQQSKTIRSLRSLRSKNISFQQKLNQAKVLETERLKFLITVTKEALTTTLTETDHHILQLEQHNKRLRQHIQSTEHQHKIDFSQMDTKLYNANDSLQDLLAKNNQLERQRLSNQDKHTRAHQEKDEEIQKARSELDHLEQLYENHLENEALSRTMLQAIELENHKLNENIRILTDQLNKQHEN